jgi:hypothetical protein
VNGIPRWILAVQDATPTELRLLPKVRDRLRLVKEFRHKSKRKSTLEIAHYPTKFNVETIPFVPFLVVLATRLRAHRLAQASHYSKQ